MIRYFISCFCFLSMALSIDVNFSLETKFGDGSKVTGQASNNPDTTDYNFIENILDINTTFDNGIFISTQLEYSDPPIFGASVMGLNNLVVDYMGDNYSIKLGNLYSLYGRGLSLNMTQNQNIDYDNSVTGIEFEYTLNDLNLFSVWGTSEFNYRSNPAFIETDLRLDNNIYFIGSEYYHDKIGMLQYSVLYEESKIGIDHINKYYSGNSDIGKELSDRFPDGFPANVNSDILKTSDHNLAWNYQFLGADFYIEKVWNTYTKILGNTESGSKLYLSLYFDISGTGITYEYKNYDQKYHIPTLSGAPIGFREGNSTLASRNSHSINWGDEVGHQIELNRAIRNLNWLGNLSFSHRHDSNNKFSDILSTNLNVLKNNESLENYSLYPFRQIYSEVSGYTCKDKFYFKLGVAQLDKVKLYYSFFQETTAFTLPSMFTYSLGGGNSITSYIEYQNKEVSLMSPDLSIINTDFYLQKYLSLTYNYSNFISFSLFYEDETHEDSINEGSETDIWQGYDITAKINSSSQFSVFYGSQKGGLVCANGVCAEQPGFDDGIKVTLRTIF